MAISFNTPSTGSLSDIYTSSTLGPSSSINPLNAIVANLHRRATPAPAPSQPKDTPEPQSQTQGSRGGPSPSPVPDPKTDPAGYEVTLDGGLPRENLSPANQKLQDRYIREQLQTALKVQRNHNKASTYGGSINKDTGAYTSPVNMAKARSRELLSILERGDPAEIAANVPGQTLEGAKRFAGEFGKGMSRAQKRRVLLQIANDVAVSEIETSQGINNLRSRAHSNATAQVGNPNPSPVPDVEGSRRFQQSYTARLRPQTQKNQQQRDEMAVAQREVASGLGSNKTLRGMFGLAGGLRPEYLPQ